jgi:hypothetical protein
MKHTHRKSLFCFLAALLCFLQAGAQEYKIGAYYYPGWTDSPGQWWNPPWEKIKPFPDREPLLGWYPEKEVWVAEKHINWASEYGIDFFAYDWYWDGRKPFLHHAIDAYLKAKNKSKIKFCLLWANHSEIPESLSQFNSMVDYWNTNYFKDPQYLKIQEKPVVIVFSPEHMRNNASRFGETALELFTYARKKAVDSGLNGIYFVGCTPATSYWVKDYMPKNGYDALTAYNYHSKGFFGGFTGKEPLAVNYTQLLDGYKCQWTWILENSRLPFFLPITAGWDKRPWGSNSVHDSCASTPELFMGMLKEAKAIVDRYPIKTEKTVLICAWNEYGEGSYVEPTKKWQFKYLEAVKKVFAK